MPCATRAVPGAPEGAGDAPFVPPLVPLARPSSGSALFVFYLSVPNHSRPLRASARGVWASPGKAAKEDHTEHQQSRKHSTGSGIWDLGKELLQNKAHSERKETAHREMEDE